VGRSRTTVLQATTHQWIGTYAGAGNGDYRGELKRALEATTRYATALALPVSQVVIRLDGLYGNAAPVTDVLHAALVCSPAAVITLYWINQRYRRVLLARQMRRVLIRKVGPIVRFTIARILLSPRLGRVCA